MKNLEVVKMVYRKFEEFVKKYGVQVDIVDGKPVYSISGYLVAFDPMPARDEDIVVAVLKRGTPTKVVYVSPATIRGQRFLGRSEFPEELSDPEILRKLLWRFRSVL